MTYKLTDEQIDSVLDAPGNLGYVIADKRARMRMFARAIADLAIAADREAHARQEVACLSLVADIRAAVGDPDGRLMQPELLERIRALATADQRRAAMREALRWASGTLYYVAQRNRAPRAADIIELDGVCRSIDEILDMADAALAPDAGGPAA